MSEEHKDKWFSKSSGWDMFRCCLGHPKLQKIVFIFYDGQRRLFGEIHQGSLSMTLFINSLLFNDLSSLG